MPGTSIASEKKRKNETLVHAQLFDDGYGNWGWVCWFCSLDKVIIRQEDLGSRNAAYKQAKAHEKRRGH
jgi:hypothetical protein